MDLRREKIKDMAIEMVVNEIKKGEFAPDNKEKIKSRTEKAVAEATEIYDSIHSFLK